MSNQPIKGVHQIRDVITEAIRDYAVTAIKLNPDVPGNALELDTTTNKINFIGQTIVKTPTELEVAISSGETNIYLANGTYSLEQLDIQYPVRLSGESKEGVIIDVSPSGSVAVNHASGTVLTGGANLDSTSPGIVTVSGMATGYMPQLSWQGAKLVLDDVPYTVNRVASGEVSGVAILEMSEPYTRESFSGKSFKLMYMLDYTILENLTVTSAENDGILDVDRVCNFQLSNVNIRGLDVINKNSYGLNLNEVYFATVDDTTISFTKTQSPFNEISQYSVYMDDVHYSNFNDLKIRNTNSNALYMTENSFVTFNNPDVVNVDGVPFKIEDSHYIDISAGFFTDFGRSGKIIDSDDVYVNTSYFTTPTIQTAIEITDSTVNLSNNTYKNTPVSVNSISGNVAILSTNIFTTDLSTASLLDISNSGKTLVESNTFNGPSTTNLIYVSGGVATINSNFLDYGMTGITATNSSTMRLANNVVENVTNGIAYDATITRSTLDSNTIDATTSAIVVAGSDNYVSNNTILSGTVVIAADNYLTVLTDIKPIWSGVVDIGTAANPFQDLYLDGDINGVNNINMSEMINGPTGIYMSGNLMTIDDHAVYINGNDATSLSVGGLQYVHYQNSVSSIWNVEHNFNTKAVSVDVYNSSDEMMIPDDIIAVDYDTVQITFATARTGLALIQGAGTRASISGTIASQYTHVQSVPVDMWSITHNLMSKDIIVQTYDSANSMYIPGSVDIIDSNSITISHGEQTTGKAVIYAPSVQTRYANASQYVHSQTTASNIWDIPHSVGSRNYNIDCFDISGSLFIPLEINTIDENNIRIITAGASSGTAVLLFDSSTVDKVFDVKYVHTQSGGASVWNINHSLGTTDYAINVFDPNGYKYVSGEVASVRTIDTNSISVTMDATRSGTAVILAPVNVTRLDDIDNLSAEVGTLTSLTTNDQGSIVDSINEIITTIGEQSRENRVINGNFDISQEYSGTKAGIITGEYIGDIVKFYNTTTAVLAWSQTTDVPTVNRRSLYSSTLTVTTADAVPSVISYTAFSMPIEGTHYYDMLMYPMVVSFYVKTNQPGTYSLLVQGAYSAAPTYRKYITPFTVIGNGAWEKKTIYIPADSTLSGYNTDENIGAEIFIVLNGGNNIATTTNDTWHGDATGDMINSLHDVTFASATSNYFSITQWKIEPGTFATPFIPRPYNEEVERLARYYQVLSGNWQVAATTDAGYTIPHRTEMRSTPTHSIKHIEVYDGAWQTPSTSTIAVKNKYSTTGNVTYGSNFTVIGGDGTYDGTESAVIHALSRL